MEKEEERKKGGKERKEKIGGEMSEDIEKQ